MNRVRGVKGAKPRTSGNGDRTAADEQYLIARNRQIAAKAAIAELDLRERRGELIPKRVALSQLGFLLVAFRQRTLLAPAASTRKLISRGLVEQEKRLAVQESITEDVCALLTELADLPEKATNPNFFKRLTAEEDQGVSSSSSSDGERLESPSKLKTEQARAKQKRAKKT